MQSKEAVRKMYAEMFSKKIKKARENTGFTQREVCEELRLKQSTLASYEIGRTQPDYETLGILADFYGVSVDWLLGTAGWRDKEPPPYEPIANQSKRTATVEEITRIHCGKKKPLPNR